jgi:diguanylate cyclase (GGDEF)-like protein
MKFHNARLAEGSARIDTDWTIRFDAPVVEIFRKAATSGHPYLFVQDEAGSPIGLLSAEDVLRRVTDPHPKALLRWMNMPAEAALESRIAAPVGDGEAISDDTSITKVTVNGVLLGVVTGDDVMVSWKSVQKTLSNYQGDAVTGLPNRATFDHHLEAECNRAKRYGHSAAAILIDLDHFKQVNDRFGHAAGDAALNIVATTLRSSLRSYDLVARFGGDEFAVVCCGCRPGEIDIVLRRLREAVFKLQADPSLQGPLPTISIGACVVHDLISISHPSQLIEAADECLYTAKRFGRNCAFRSEVGGGMSGKAEFVEDIHADAEYVRSLLPTQNTAY